MSQERCCTSTQALTTGSGSAAGAREGDLGIHDFLFERSEIEAYRRDVPNAEIHVRESSHFALDTAADEIAVLV
jgi:hypothetical protein